MTANALGPAKCHAGAGHGPADDRGTFGWLCDVCWTRVERIMDRLLRRVTP